MSKKTFNYLVTLPFVNCSKLNNKSITKLLGCLENSRIGYEIDQLNLRNRGMYISPEYDYLHNKLLHIFQDFTTLVNMLKVDAEYIGLSSTSITQISQSK